MNSEQRKVWSALQDNRYHQWMAQDLIATPVVESRPFLDSVMSAGFIFIALIAIYNFIR